MDSRKKTIIHWFRKGLRVHDNPSLKIAVDHVLAAPESRCLRPIFILDPDILKWLKVGPNRWRFLQQSLIDLDRNLRTINSRYRFEINTIGTVLIIQYYFHFRLFIVKSGSPSTVFKRIFGEWNVTTLTYETDIEPYAVKRDEQINEMAKEFSIKIISVNSHTIYDPHLINQRNNNQPIITLRKFISLAEGVPIAEPIPVPDSVPSESKPDADSFERNDGNCYNCPTLTELGVEESSLGECLFPGGETEGLKRLAESLKDEKWVCAFEKPNTHPNSLTPSTTVLSPYLKFGCLSSRLFYKQLKQVYARHKIHSKPPVSLEAQLLWREFYYCASLGSPNFDKMENNKICMQIDWQENKDHLECWTWGRTGYPFIDAIMRQLRQEGWVHHLARHAVACFLTRGDLYISWEEGQKVFEELLLDADWALNAGNWMWLSASAFFHQFFRVYRWR